MRLHDIAHARTGDKGTTNTISIFAREEHLFGLLDEVLTIERITEHMRDFVDGEIEKFSMPNIAAIQLVAHGMRRGDVTTALDLDVHGKTLGAIALEMKIPDEVVRVSDLRSRRRIGGYQIPNGPLYSPRPLVIVLAGGGIDPVEFDPLFDDVDANIIHLDYLLGPGQWYLYEISASLCSQLSHRCGEIYLVGHSLGGALAILIAGQLGKSVTGLVLSDTGLTMVGHNDMGFLERLNEGWDSIRHEEFIQNCTAQPLPAAQHSRFLAHLSSTPIDAFVQAAGSLRVLDMRSTAATITAPTTIFHGVLDARRDLESATFMHSMIPGSLLYLLNCGHTPFVEAPDEARTLLNAVLPQFH